MKIGIIGAGQIGGTLTRRLTALGHKVFVANSRGPETLSDLAAETGATAVSVPEAVRGVLILAETTERVVGDDGAVAFGIGEGCEQTVHRISQLMRFTGGS